MIGFIKKWNRKRKEVTAKEALDDLIKRGYVKENPDNPNEVKLTALGWSVYGLLKDGKEDEANKLLYGDKK